MSVIVSLVPSPVRLARLRSAAREVHTVVPCERWDDLFRTCREQMIHVAIVDLEAAATPTFDAVRRLKRAHPHLALIGYAGASIDRFHHIFDAGRAGFDEIVIADVEDGPTAFSRAIEKAAARSVAGAVRSQLPRAADPVATDALLVTITRAHERLTPAALASVLGISTRTLGRALAASGYPPPQKLVMWGRLVVAASLMEGTRHSAERIALTLRFPSGSAFRNNCQRYLAASPSEIRARGGAGYVLGQLREHMGMPAPWHTTVPGLQN